jgi:hypothetical protein
MKPDLDKHLIYDPIDADYDIDQLYKDNKMDILAVFDDKELVVYRKKRPNSELVNLVDDNLSNDNNLFINVSISAAITGYSRIFMSDYKNQPNIKLYYSDTDSIFIDIDLEILDNSLIGSQLGQ